MPTSAACVSRRPVKLRDKFTCPQTGKPFSEDITIEAPAGSSVTWVEVTKSPGGQGKH